MMCRTRFVERERTICLHEHLSSIFVPVPLTLRSDAVHIRVTCDGCREASAELCAKRQTASAFRLSAVTIFKRNGWHHDANPRAASARAEKDSEANGSGRWYCPGCSSKSHL